MYLCVRILRGDGGEGVVCGELCWVGLIWGYVLMGGYLTECHDTWDRFGVLLCCSWCYV